MSYNSVALKQTSLSFSFKSASGISSKVTSSTAESRLPVIKYEIIAGDMPGTPLQSFRIEWRIILHVPARTNKPPDNTS